MKKTLLALVLLAGSTVSFAQIQKGNLFLGGSIGLNSSSEEDKANNVTVDGPKTFGGNFSPRAGYFLTDNIAAGVDLNIFGSTRKFKVANVDNEDRTSGFGAGLFGRYYAGINEKFYFFGELNVGFSGAKVKNKAGGVETDVRDVSAFGVGVNPGFTYFPSTRFGLDFSVGLLGLSNVTTTNNPGAGNENENKTSNFDLNFDMTAINIGVQFFLNK